LSGNHVTGAEYKIRSQGDDTFDGSVDGRIITDGTVGVVQVGNDRYPERISVSSHAGQGSEQLSTDDSQQCG
jgi:hypothetical protein